MSTHTNALPEGYVISSGNQQYRIVKILGHGGFGITYLASSTIKHGNLSFNVHFAVKEHFLSDSCERDAVTQSVSYSNPTREKVENSKKDFLAEARRLHKVGVDHPNIVKVNEVFEANNTAYYVMEYLEGQSLRGYVEQNGPMTEAGMWAVMTPVINAVAYLHDNRMTHLDIKPDNIMLAKDEEGNIMRPVLIDFGLSKHYTEDGRPTSTLNALGLSNGYSPIEQYAGITTFSPEADVYALGATMLFCLTGKDPVKSTDLKPGDVERMIPAGVSETTAKTIVEAMQMFKAARPSDARALLSAYDPSKISKKTEPVSPEPQPIPNGEADSVEKTVIVDTPAGKASSLRKWGLIAALVTVVGVIGMFSMFKDSDSTSMTETAPKTVAENVNEDSVIPAAVTPEPMKVDEPAVQPKAEQKPVETDNRNKKLRPKKINGKWGYVDGDGNVAIQPQWDMCDDFGDQYGEFARVWIRDVGDGLIDKSGKYIIPPKCSSIQPFSEGLALVDIPGEASVFYDKKGNVAVRFPKGYAAAGYCYRNGMVSIRKAGTNIFGYADRNGRIVVEPQYDQASDFNKAGIAFVKRMDGKCGGIDKSGNTVVQFIYDGMDINDSRKNRVRLTLNGESFLVDDYGNRID